MSAACSRLDEPFPAQIQPDVLRRLDGMARLHRLAALSTELYGANWLYGLMGDMRVTSRTVRRWKQGAPIPDVVIVAAGAMVQAKRAGV